MIYQQTRKVYSIEIPITVTEHLFLPILIFVRRFQNNNHYGIVLFLFLDLMIEIMKSRGVEYDIVPIFEEWKEEEHLRNERKRKEREDRLERDKIRNDPNYKDNEEISKNRSKAAKASWAKRKEGKGSRDWA